MSGFDGLLEISRGLLWARPALTCWTCRWCRCSSAEIGVFMYDELRALLFGLARSNQVVGFDLVEVNPMVDVGSDNTSLLAAQLIIEFLGRIRQPQAHLQTVRANSVSEST